MGENRKKFWAIQVPKTAEGMATHGLLDSLITHTRTTPAQKVQSKRSTLTAWIVVTLALEYAIEQAGSVDALGEIISQETAKRETVIDTVMVYKEHDLEHLSTAQKRALYVAYLERKNGNPSSFFPINLATWRKLIEVGLVTLDKTLTEKGVSVATQLDAIIQAGGENFFGKWVVEPDADNEAEITH